MARYVIHLEDPEALDPGRCGHKLAALARALRAGLPVPPTAVVTVEAHAAARAGGWPNALDAELTPAADRLGLEAGLAVRSSAVAEDLGDASFAGLYESFLDIRSRQELRDAIRRCWASADSPRVATYRREKGLGPEATGMAVVVQRMIQPAAAGVAFSRNPIYPQRDEVVVEAVAGLGDRLAAGAVSPHRAFVGGDGVRVSPPAAGGPGPGDTQPSAPLDAEGWRRVARLARRMEEAAGEPQDIEWALDGEGRIWLLQCRPITALGGAAGGAAVTAAAGGGAPAGTWTRALAVDLWADRLSPFLAQRMLATAHRWDLSAAARFVGVPVPRPTLAVIRGYLYVSCDSLRAALATLPGALRIPELGDIFPPGMHLGEVPAPGPGRLLARGLRAAVYGLAHPQANPLLCRRLTRHRGRRLAAELAAVEALPHATPQASLNRVSRAAELLTALQVHNQWPYTYATVLTWVFRRLLTGRGRLAPGDALTLLADGARNVTLAMDGDFQRLAAAAAADAELSRRLATETPESILATPPPRFRAALETFLHRYGCRARHRSLTVPRWAEAPEEVVAMLARMAAGSEAGSATAPGRAPGRRRAAPVWRKLPPVRRWVVRRLQRFTRGFLDLREELRFELDGCLYLLRRSLLDLGEQIGLGEDVFHLTLEELARVVHGDLEPAAARATAAERRRAREDGAPAYSFYVDARPSEGLAGARGRRLPGVATSPGRATGRARVVAHPTEEGIDAGAILVAVHADPGWTPILRRAAGIVLEEGGLLNHCSIVARELGIPAVVGVRGATRAIGDGAEVTVDGNLGWVELGAGADP